MAWANRCDVLVKITRVRGVVYEYPLTRRIGDVHLACGTDRGSNVAVFIDTDEGVTGHAVGFAQAGPELSRFEPVLLGEDPRSVRGLWERMCSLVFKWGPAEASAAALSAIDCALWDLRARANDMPLWRELGALDPRVRLYASGLDTPLDDDALASYYRRMAGMGLHAGKLKVGADQDADLRRLGIMRDALATSGCTPLLMVDANEYWSAKQAIARVREFERHFDLLAVEEPTERRDIVGLAKVSAAVTAAVATGENLVRPEDFVPLIRAGAVDICQVSPALGITGAMRVAELTACHQLPVSIMNNPGRFMAHAAAAMGNHTMMEVLDCGRDAVMNCDHRIVGGVLELGNEPGCGFTYDLDALATLAVERPSSTTREQSYRRAAMTGRDEYRSG
jgi:L-alanine-DL-glutamate epimerase-like enolase superfamily enzyme